MSKTDMFRLAEPKIHGVKATRRRKVEKIAGREFRKMLATLPRTA